MKKILVIDDKHDNLVTIQAVLKSSMPVVNVITAQSGLDGLKLAREEQPDTILLDIKMPDMDGYEVCRRLKADPELHIIPVIMLTAIMTDTESRVNGLELGADAFLTKPINADELVAQINVMLRIKGAEDALREERDSLEARVQERTLKLQESEEKYRALYENAPLSYQSLDENGRFLDINPTWLSTLGYEQEEVIGKRYIDFLHPDWQAHFEKNFPAFKKRGYVHDVEFKIKHKQGHYLDIMFEGCIGYNEDGSVRQTYCVFQDVTKRKQAERQLRESEQVKRAIADYTADWESWFGKDGKMLWVNPAVEKITGFSITECEEMTNYPFPMIYNEDRQLFKDSLERAISERSSINHFEFRILHKNGSIRWAAISWQPIFDDQEGHLGLRTSIRDITEYKQAEETLSNSLLRSEAKYRSVVHDLTENIMRFLPDGTRTFVNDSYCQTFGITEEEALKTNLFNGMSKPAAERIRKKLAGLTPENPVKSDEHESIQDDGNSVWRVWVDRGFFDDNGVLIEVLATGHEITNRKRAEDRIKENEAMLQAAMDNSQAGIAIAEVPSGELKYVNEAGLMIRGKNYDEIAKDIDIDKYVSSWQILYSDGTPYKPEDVPLARAVLNGETVREEFIIRRANDEDRYVLAHAAPINNDKGERIAAIVVFQDITENKQTEENLEEALGQAKAANEVKDQFIANISHEIRTPLNSILGFSDLLQKRLDQSIPDQDFKLFEFIASSSNRLMRTVDSILNTSQLQAGTIEVQPSKLDLTSLVGQISAEFNSLADQKNLEFISVIPDKSVTVFADDYCIRQAISNIVENALKYTFEGSVSLNLGLRKGQVTLSIADTGIGISEEYQKRIFDAYTQESEGFTKSYQGIGLGLSLAKQYLDMNNVEIEMESKKEVGTTFTLIFPTGKG